MQKQIYHRNHFQHHAQDYILVPRAAVEALVNSLKLDQMPQGAVSDFDPGVFVREFQDACKVDYRLHSSTVCGHIRYVKRLVNFLGKHPRYASRQELRQFLRINPTQNAVKAVRVLFQRFLNSDLASCFKVPKTAPHPIMVPSRDQVRKTYANLKTLRTHKDSGPLEPGAMFLLLASSGLRIHEAKELVVSQIDLEKRMILPGKNTSRASGLRQQKLQWITFYNQEAERDLTKLMAKRSRPDEKIFERSTFFRIFKRASRPTGCKITPQILREWFSCEMGRLGVPDRYVDAFCGRIPKGVIGRHYTDYSPERLREIYDKASLRVLDNGFHPVTG